MKLRSWMDVIYINKKDSRLLVPKPGTKIGWNYNFGQVQIYIFLGAILMVIVLCMFVFGIKPH